MDPPHHPSRSPRLRRPDEPLDRTPCTSQGPAGPRRAAALLALRRPPARWMVAALVLAAISPALLAVEIWLFKVVVDDVLIPRDFGLFPVVAATYVGLTVVQAICDGADRLLSTWLSQRFLVDVRTALLHHLQQLPLEFLNRNRLGDVMSRVTGDVSAIESFLVSGSSRAVSSLLQLVFFSIALFVLQPLLALVALVVTPLFWAHLPLFRAPAQGDRPRAPAPLGHPQHLARADPQHPAPRAGLRPGRARGARGTPSRPRASTAPRWPPRDSARSTPRRSTSSSCSVPSWSSAPVPGSCPRTR